MVDNPLVVDKPPAVDKPPVVDKPLAVDSLLQQIFHHSIVERRTGEVAFLLCQSLKIVDMIV